MHKCFLSREWFIFALSRKYELERNYWLWFSSQARYSEITSDPAYLDQILSEGARKAADIAETTLNNVYQAMGFLQR